MTTPFDDRSPLARAYQWSSRIMVVSLEMILPGLAGYWADRQLGTLFLFTLVGFALGCTGGIRHLLRLTRSSAPDGLDRGDLSDGDKRGE